MSSRATPMAVTSPARPSVLPRRKEPPHRLDDEAPLTPQRAAATSCVGADRASSAAIDLVKTRTSSMNRATAGFRVRFLSVTAANGHGRNGSSTGNIFKDSSSALNRRIEAGNTEMKGPLASNDARSWIE